MVNTRWEYGKVTRALLDFTPLTHKWERSKGCWFNCIISWDWFFHTWGLNSHCVCKTLYFCTFFSAFFTEGRSTIFVNFQDLWQPGLLSVQTWTPSPVLLETTGKKYHIIWTTSIEFSVVKPRICKITCEFSGAWAESWIISFWKRNYSSSAVLGNLWSDGAHGDPAEFTGA